MPGPSIHPVDRQAPEPGLIARAAACLQAGGLVVFPTDTVYGLGCDAENEQALQRLYRAKGRPLAQPLIVLLAHPGELTRHARVVPHCARLAAARFWPGPLTIIVPAQPGLSATLLAGGDTIGLRVPADEVARALASRVVLASTSANRSGRPAPVTAAQAVAELGEAVDMVLDGGAVGGQASTVLDCAVSPPRLLRQGPISAAMLREVIGEVSE